MKLDKIFLLVLLFAAKSVCAQSNDPDSSGVVNNSLLPNTVPTLLFNDADDKAKEQKRKKKKTKKNVFFGEKTKRSFIKQSLKNQTQIQYYYYTTSKRKIDPYIRDVYWIDTRDKVIRTKDFDPANGYLLHGPYEKRVDDVLVESGMYFFGTKHGRWMKYNNKNILLDKAHYNEGWPKASRVSYHNRSERKIEKVTPIEYDLEEGNFFHFYEDGQIAVIGEFHYGEKVGLWTEYWNTKNSKMMRKREIQYQDEPFSKNFIPFIKAEWDKDGNLIYRHE